MIAGGLAVTLQENLPTEPWVTTIGVGWLTKDEIPGIKQMGGS